MENQIQTIDNFGWLSSIWRITTVNPLVEKSGHIAPFPKEIPNRLIRLFSNEGEYILDPFCGSGTTNFVALALGRKTIGYDIEGKYIEISKKRCNYKGLFFCKSSECMNEVYDNSIRLCITSPPYLGLRNYSNDPNNIGNMENPFPTFKKVFKEIHRTLKFGGYFCLNVSDVYDKERKEFTTFPYDLINLCKEIGFRLKSVIVWDKDTNLKEWNIMNNQINTNHEYIWVLRK